MLHIRLLCANKTFLLTYLLTYLLITLSGFDSSSSLIRRPISDHYKIWIRYIPKKTLHQTYIGRLFCRTRMVLRRSSQHGTSSDHVDRRSTLSRCWRRPWFLTAAASMTECRRLRWTRPAYAYATHSCTAVHFLKVAHFDINPKPVDFILANTINSVSYTHLTLPTIYSV